MQHIASIESLTELFGVEPHLEYPNIPFDQNGVQFEVDLGAANVWFNFFGPGSWAELRIRHTPFSLVKLNFSAVTHLSVRKTAEDHYLHIQFASTEVASLQLHLRPTLLLFWGNDRREADGSHLEPADNV